MQASADQSLDSAEILEAMKARKRPTAKMWSDEEHSTFVDALRTYGKKWYKIAEIVGTRDYKQCFNYSRSFVTKIKNNPNIYGADLLPTLLMYYPRACSIEHHTV